MWKKNEDSNQSSSAQSTSSTNEMNSNMKSSLPVDGATRATIGQTIHINGEISGEEDLLVQGTVEGKINLAKFNVSVGKHGVINGDIYATQAEIQGEVNGIIKAADVIRVRPSGIVNGDIIAPRVILEDGCQFKGTIDMSSAPKVNAAVQPAVSTSAASVTDAKQSSVYDAKPTAPKP